MDKSPLDAWTAVHAGVGIVAGYMGVPLILWIILNVIFELVENWRRPEKTIPFLSPESNANIGIDVMICIVGWFVGRALRTATSTVSVTR